MSVVNFSKTPTVRVSRDSPADPPQLTATSACFIYSPSKLYLLTQLSINTHPKYYYILTSLTFKFIYSLITSFSCINSYNYQPSLHIVTLFVLTSHYQLFSPFYTFRLFFNFKSPYFATHLYKAIFTWLRI